MNIPAVWIAFCAPEMIPWIGPNESLSDGGGMLKKFGNFGNDLRTGNGLMIGNGFTIGNDLINGTATGTGKIIGDFFKLWRMAAVLAILATLSALRALTAPNFNANDFFATRNGAVRALNAAIFVAFA